MLHILVLFLFLPLPTVVISSPKWRPVCGGALTAQRGVISTPNFPQVFNTPIHCQWHIDAQHVRQTYGDAMMRNESLSIKIYLTQVYVHEGLKVVEYESKDAYDYRLEGRRVFTLNEEAVTSNKTYIFIEKEYVVVDFQLDRTESTHLRVLDGLLNVYGFNITYEITTQRERRNRCSMKLCGFTGYCYDDFVHFKCDCFPGFWGRRCSEGPKSKCIVNGQPACENGAECLHTGHTAFVCDCPPGFRGSFCEIRDEDIAPTTGCGSDPECLISCKFNGTMEDVCQCTGKSSNNLQAINESIGYSSRIFVQSKLSEIELREILKHNMLDTLKVNISNIDDVNIISSTTANNETDVTLRFYASKYQDELVRSTIRKWGRAQYARNDKHYVLTEKDILVKTEPYLYLENIAIDKNGVISEGDEFVLSCTARGSRFMIFRWFMNGYLVNLTRANKNKWEELISKGRSNTDHYTALLVVQKSTRFDRGRFTCHVEDYGVQQCRSLQVEMNYQPQIKLEPASLTVDKGQPFTITCISLATFGEKYKFSWTKDKSLLPIKTETEHYEILYPGGSILQVAGLNKSTWYSCLAHLDKLSSESKILVHVVDKRVAHPCPTERLDEYDWPETATGGDCRLECPDGYYGAATRACIMLENGAPRWLPPDYSNCTRHQLIQHLRDFRYLVEGYATTTPLQTLINIKRYVVAEKLLRGEGRVILQHVERVVSFNNASFGYSDHEAITDVVLDIVDAILAQNVSLNKEQQVVTLQQLVRNQLMVLAPHIRHAYRKSLHNLQATIEIDSNRLSSTRVISVDYRNLYEFLTKKSVIRLNYSDDREMKYELFAGVTSIWRLNTPLTSTPSAGSTHIHKPSLKTDKRISTVFRHQHTRLSDNTLDALTLSLSLSESSTSGTQKTNSEDLPINSNTRPTVGVVKCVLAEYAASDYVWNAYKCRILSENTSSVRCECDEEGTMTILLVDDVQSERAELHLTACDDIVLVGCAVCAVACAISGILLVLSWIRHKSTMTFLKAQCALSLAACMLCFIFGFSDSISKRFYLNVLSCLLIFYLMALSSQLSTLLIIYTDLIEMQQITSIKPTVVGIITGAPVIAVFANHLTHNIKDISLVHWWIVRDTLSFYMFIVCIAIVFILYVILCCLVSKLLKTDKTKSDKILSNRSTMMTKSTLIFTIVTISAGSSVACVNHPEEIIWQYAFAATSIFMGVIIMLCLVFKVRAMSRKYFWDRLNRRGSSGTNAREKDPTNKGSKDGKGHHISHNKYQFILCPNVHITRHHTNL
ncbi:uncharacterized protein [Atheta coriaria]|uniref:uncharacterized protein isoform X3 n=1 Tax=Dalotia coriaria TaxID=877792 RepID=UPI0031F350C2